MIKNGRNRESEERRIDGRIFLSGIKNLSKRDVQDWFSKYGKIIDIVIFERHVLVQFEREGDAARAVGREKGESYRGFKFEIRYAYSSDGSMSSRADVVRNRSPINMSYERRPRDISPDRADFERINNEDRPRSSARSDLSSSVTTDTNRNSQLVSTRTANEKHSFDAAIIIMSSDLLNYAESIDLKCKRQIELTTHIVVLKEESHANACIEDLEKKGVLYAFLINHMNVKHSSCTLRILHGIGQEHRNMLLTNALAYVARNFEDYQKSNKQSKSIESTPNFDPSRMPPGFVAPDDTIIYQLHLLADSRMLTIDELTDVDEFIQKRINVLSQAEGVVPQTNGMLSGHQMSLNSVPQFSGSVDNEALLNNTMDTFVKENEASLNALNPIPVSKAQHPLDSLMQSQFRSDQIDNIPHNFQNQPNNPYLSQNMSMNPTMHQMNVNRMQNIMNVPMRNMQPNMQYPNNYNGYFQQPPLNQPGYRPRTQFQPRPQYPGY